MYIRATKTHTKGGKPAKSYRLSRSVRIGDKVRQETLLNLGVDYPVPKQQWRDVILVTEVLLHGRQPMLPVPADIQAAAEDLVRRLRAQGLGPQEPAQTGRGRAMATVDLDTLEHEEPRSVGGERVCLAGLEELGFRALLHEQGVRGRDARIAIALVVAKMLHPNSERESLRWLQEDSAALELLDLDRGKAVSRLRRPTAEFPDSRSPRTKSYGPAAVKETPWARIAPARQSRCSQPHCGPQGRGTAYYRPRKGASPDARMARPCTPRICAVILGPVCAMDDASTAPFARLWRAVPTGSRRSKPSPRSCSGGGMRFRCAVAQRCRPELGIPNRLRAFPPSAVRGSRPSGPQCRSATDRKDPCAPDDREGRGRPAFLIRPDSSEKPRILCPG